MDTKLFTMIFYGRYFKRILTMIFLLSTSVLYAQTTSINNLLPQLTPKSPNVAALGRYGEYPVSMFTGVPTIEIPIFTIEMNGMSIPIKLSYHASGHKVTDAASLVGLGWSLQYGGAVTRQVRGLPDEINAGLLGKSIPIDILASVNASCYNEQVRDTYRQMAENVIDTERDLFSVNVPGKSNQFILRNVSDYQWLNPEASKIKFTRSTNSNNSNSYFELVDEKGVQYLLNETEVTNDIGTSAWLLKTIQGTRSQDKIMYEYYSGTSYTRTHDIMEAVTINDNGTGNVPAGIITPTPGTPTPDLISVNSAVEQKLPKFIYFPLGKIEFVLEAGDRQDGLGKALDKIKIYSYNEVTQTNQLIKTYDLVYQYLNRQDNSPVLFLDEVKLLDNADAEIGKYKISYNTTTALPAVQSKSKDYWGYYNGIYNTTLIPAQTIPMYYQNSGASTLAIGGGNRESKEDFMKAWIITRMTFPTGGYTDFEFEANRYYNGTEQKQAGGLRIKKISSWDGINSNPVIKYYKYGQDESGNGRLRESLSLQYETKQKIINYDPIVSGAPTAPKYTYETRRYTSNLTGALFPNEGSPVTYTYVSEYDDAGVGNSGKTIYQFRDANDTKISLNRGAKFFVNSKHWNRGQMISKKVYDKNGVLKYSQNNTYEIVASGTTSDFCGRLLQVQNTYTGFRTNYTQGNSTCYYNTDDATPAQTYYFEYGTTKLVKSEEFFYNN